MGCRIAEFKECGLDGDDRAVLFDSVTETVFGPIIESVDEAAVFLCWLAESSKWRGKDTVAGRGDPRGMKDGDVHEAYSEFRAERVLQKEGGQ